MHLHFRFSKLLREDDGDDYDIKKFKRMRVQNFRLYIITQNKTPTRSLMERTYPMLIVMNKDEIK